MPAALATLATERSISAVRMTKVRPVAMIAVIETWRRMLPRLSTVAKDGLSALNTTTRNRSVIRGAMLVSRAATQRHTPEDAAAASIPRGASACMSLAYLPQADRKSVV